MKKRVFNKPTLQVVSLQSQSILGESTVGSPSASNITVKTSNASASWGWNPSN